jgi:SHS2 domain-containing protein
MVKDYEFLEHTADIYVKVTGKSLTEAFENAGKATTDVMTDLNKVEPLMEYIVSIEAEDPQELLYLWIEEILFRFDTEGTLFSGFIVQEINEGEDFSLKATIRGEEFNPDKHTQRVGVKAITYHMMEIKRNEEVTLKFILDV